MGTIRERTVFTTEDGKEHHNLQDAQAHDRRLELVKAIAMRFHAGGQVKATAAELADWLIENYDMEKH